MTRIRQSLQPLLYAAFALGLCLGCGGIVPARAQGAPAATASAR